MATTYEAFVQKHSKERPGGSMIKSLNMGAGKCFDVIVPIFDILFCFNNNQPGFYIAFFQIMIKALHSSNTTPVIHRIQNQFCTQSALSPLPEEHSGMSPCSTGVEYIEHSF